MSGRSESSQFEDADMINDTCFISKISIQRLQKLIYLHLFTDCFMMISLHSLEPS